MRIMIGYSALTIFTSLAFGQLLIAFLRTL
jgi:hypothetical protein